MQGENEEEEEIVVLNKLIAFKAYSSIEISTRDKFINSIKNAGLDAKEVLWVASEKIHGSNFSIHFNGEVARYGRRTDFLTEDIPVPCKDNLDKYFKESFFNAKSLVTKYNNNLGEVYARALKKEPSLLRLSIYGEYFGGLWPQNEEKEFKAVQKGVYYTPYHEFYAFDIFFVCNEKFYWVDVLDIPLILEGIIPTVPVYRKGTFEEMMALNSLIDSTIPELLKLPTLKDNTIEGFVIRPNENCCLKNGKRVVLKKKNAEFLEKVNAPTINKITKKKEISPMILPYLEEILKYLNFNRIESVISKYPDTKDRRFLGNAVVTDILLDAEKDEFKKPEAELLKIFNDELSKAVMKEINDYFVKH